MAFRPTRTWNLCIGTYRLLWYRQPPHSRTRPSCPVRRVQRAWVALGDLRTRLQGPRTRFREQAKGQQAVDAILTSAKSPTGQGPD